MDRASSTAVLREALAGSDAALDTLYERFGPRLLSFIRLKMGRSLRARLESRDILQATFLKSFQRRDDFEGEDGRSLLGWLMRIAEHEIRDRADFHHRQRRDLKQEQDIGGDADHLRDAYRALDARDDDWIVESRALSYTQITLYLGAFLLVCGSLFYFVASRWYHTVQGLARPLAVLGLPFVGLNLAARHLYRRDHKAVAVAFYLAAIATLPLLLMILFDETGFLVAPHGASSQLFPGGSVSNHQLQVTTLVACFWCGVLALSTRTMALSTVFATLGFVFGLSVAADFGLRSWIRNERWDLLALHLSPLIAAYVGLGIAADRMNRAWLSRPLYRGAALLFIVLMELLALNGRTFQYLGFSLQAWQSPTVSDPQLLDTIAAMTLNGLCFYAIAAILQRRGTELMADTAGLLFAVSPFAVLQPLAYLVRSEDYSPRYDWIYLALALSVTLLSERRQRKSFYYAGLLNTGAALLLIAGHRHWFDRPSWGAILIVLGLAALGAGFILDRQSRNDRH